MEGLLNRSPLTTWCEKSVYMCLSRHPQRNSARGAGSGAEWAVAKWSGRSLLTPVPAFQASSPQDLRLFYEKNKTLVPT